MRIYRFLIAGLILAVVVAALMVRSHAVSASSNATAIDLTPFVNAKLSDSFSGPRDMKFNSLGDLPRGRQVFAGTPFQISGIVQLSGTKLQSWGRDEYPDSVFDIPVNKTCRHVYILHGAAGVEDPDRTTIAELILHYSDNSVSTLRINVGEHVRDWWGSGSDKVPGKDTQLAWLGNNLAIEERWSGAKLRLYRTVFKNPKPDLLIAKIDYMSRKKIAASFMVGLAVD